MSLEDAMMGGIVFKGKKDGPKKLRKQLILKEPMALALQK